MSGRKQDPPATMSDAQLIKALVSALKAARHYVVLRDHVQLASAGP